MKKQLLLFVLLSTGYALFGQTTVNLNPSQDNSIFSNLFNNSNGTGLIYSARTSAGNLRRALMQFDLSSIPSNAIITSVTLTLNTDRVRGGAIPYTLHRVTTAWGEGISLAQGQGTTATHTDATWNAAMSGTSTWTTPGGDFIATPSTTHMFPETTGNTTIPTSTGLLVADVQSWVDGTNANNGWILISPEVVINKNTITVYPNPSNDGIFNINSAQNIALETAKVFNILGQRIRIIEANTPSNTMSIDLSELKSGMYLLTINDS